MDDMLVMNYKKGLKKRMSRKNWKFLKQKLLTAFIPWHAHVWHVQAMFKMFDFYKVGVKKLKMQHDNAAIHL